jgi:hypothetical protein
MKPSIYYEASFHANRKISNCMNPSRVLAQQLTLGRRCDIDGQPERVSGWEDASQCEELTAIFVTILKRAKTS